MDYKKLSLEKHFEWKGKLQVKSKIAVTNKEELSLAYTPGVASPCMAISKNKELSFELTSRWNTVAVITDGSAVLGLGNIGAEASMPVMEGKCVLFSEFAGIDAIPISLITQDSDELVNIIYNMSPSFGGINLEDISAPRCFEIEKRLKELCDIPVFHDDQHGTAIVLGAALINALKLVGKQLEVARIVVNGAGSAGIAITNFLILLGAKDIVLCDRLGIVYDNKEKFNNAQIEAAKGINPRKVEGLLEDAIKGSDVFVGVSVSDVLTKEMVMSMGSDSIVFAMANPNPEIEPALAHEGGARVVATGRSDLPNQINNVLAFPGIFRGALDIRAKSITEQMKVEACKALASLVDEDSLSEEYIIPEPFDIRVVPAVAEAVKRAHKK